MNPLRLPLLEPHRAALETCVYCPKLSRAACPVSNAEASETVTPWGKMSLAYFAARGDVPLDEEHAKPAWACSACYACRERCDHKNEVATVLTDARAELFSAGLAPAGAKMVVEDFPARAAAVSRAVDVLEESPPPADAPALLVGCGYARRAPEVAADAVRVTEKLLGKRVRLVRACCGLPLLHAGDQPGFRAAAEKLAGEVGSAKEVHVVDPGCAKALLVDYPRLAPSVRLPKAEVFVDLVRRSLGSLRTLDPAPQVRWHDPCQLGRGLGRYDEPRAILRKLTGEGPQGFTREREHGECSGGGGLLPATRPDTSALMAKARIAEHQERGGGLLVTHCASSLLRFRKSGEAAEDLVTLVARALVT